MLPEATAKAGYCVFNASREPYQNPGTTATIRRIIIAVWKYSFLHKRLGDDFVNYLPSTNETFFVNIQGRALKLNALKVKKGGKDLLESRSILARLDLLLA